MIEQTGGGHQRAAVQVAHADVRAVAVVVVHVKAELRALQAGVELAAEHPVAQRLGFAQGAAAAQAHCLEAAFGRYVTSKGDLAHALASVSRPSGLRPVGFVVQAQAKNARCHHRDVGVMLV
ncbi:hypothetical protein D3C80_1621790 [compost metagenome]